MVFTKWGKRMVAKVAQASCLLFQTQNLLFSVSSSNALRSLSTSTALLPFVSRPRWDSCDLNSTTFNFAGSIACIILWFFSIHTLLPHEIFTKSPIHAPVTRATYTIWRYDCKQRVTYDQWILLVNVTLDVVPLLTSRLIEMLVIQISVGNASVHWCKQGGICSYWPIPLGCIHLRKRTSLPTNFRWYRYAFDILINKRNSDNRNRFSSIMLINT